MKYPLPLTEPSFPFHISANEARISHTCSRLASSIWYLYPVSVGLSLRESSPRAVSTITLGTLLYVENVILTLVAFENHRSHLHREPCIG